MLSPVATAPSPTTSRPAADTDLSQVYHVEEARGRHAHLPTSQGRTPRLVEQARRAQRLGCCDRRSVASVRARALPSLKISASKCGRFSSCRSRIEAFLPPDADATLPAQHGPTLQRSLLQRAVAELRGVLCHRAFPPTMQ